MLEVLELDDGRFAVRDVGGASLDDVLGIFDTENEANEFALSEALVREGNQNEPHIQKPGGGQGIS
jgi:hypothetical protein